MTPEQTIQRPASCPRPGQIPAFDAGWNAHEVGIGRASIAAFTPASGQSWALLGR